MGRHRKRIGHFGRQNPVVGQGNPHRNDLCGIVHRRHARRNALDDFHFGQQSAVAVTPPLVRDEISQRVEDGTRRILLEGLHDVRMTADDQIRATVADTFARTGYLLDPHGACGYRALRDGLRDGETGIFLETAHPAKFLDTVESITGRPVEIPQRLQEFVKGEKRTVALGAEFEAFKEYLLSR